MAQKFKVPDSALVVLKIGGGLLTGATLGMIAELAIRGAFGASDNPDVLAAAQVLRAVIVGFGAFWIRAYTDDIIVKPQAPTDRVRLKADGWPLGLYTLFVGLSVMTGANAVAKGVDTLLEKWWSVAELHIMNYTEVEMLEPPLADFSKISWHFFFEEGNLCEHSNCDPSGELYGASKQACVPENIALHGGAVERYQDAIRKARSKQPKDLGPFDDRGNLLGTSFEELSDEAAIKRMSEIVVMAAYCATSTSSPSDAGDMLVLSANASGRGWEGCDNDLELNEALARARADRMTTLFVKAKERAATASPNLASVIDKVSLIEESARLFDFTDRGFSASDASRGLREGGQALVTPYKINQSAAIVLLRPKGCAISAEANGAHNTAKTGL